MDNESKLNSNCDKLYTAFDEWGTALWSEKKI